MTATEKTAHVSKPRAGGWPARYSDGRTAASTTGHVTLVPARRAVVFTPANNEPASNKSASFRPEPLHWHFEHLTTSGPVRRQHADVLLQNQGTPGAVLFVDKPDFATALLEVAPHLGRKAHLGRMVRPALAVGAVLFALLGLGWALDVSPARTIAGWLPTEVRREMGAGLVTALTSQYPACETSEGRDALDGLVARFAAADPTIDVHQVLVLPIGLPNAFALPGGTLILTDGLLQQADGPDEVAGVLAHELGHAKYLHPEAGIVRQLGISLAADLVFAGSSDTLTSAGSLLVQLNYSRDAEREADAEGLRLLAATRINPTPLQGFMERISGGSRDGGDTGDQEPGAAPEMTGSDAAQFTPRGARSPDASYSDQTQPGTRDDDDGSISPTIDVKTARDAVPDNSLEPAAATSGKRNDTPSRVPRGEEDATATPVTEPDPPTVSPTAPDIAESSSAPSSDDSAAGTPPPATDDEPRSRVGTLLKILSSHPATAERIAMIAAAPRYPSEPAMTAADWQALSMMCAGDAENGPSQNATDTDTGVGKSID